MFFKTINFAYPKKDKIITDSVNLTETFNKSFNNIAKNLNIDDDTDNKTVYLNIEDSVSRVIKKFKCHPSILRFNRFMKNNNMSFSLTFFTQESVIKQISNSNPRKACQDNDIPIKIKKTNAFFLIFIPQFL